MKSAERIAVMLTIILNAIAVVLAVTCIWFVFEVFMALFEWRRAESTFWETHPNIRKQAEHDGD